jgi:hypothetical protein
MENIHFLFSCWLMIRVGSKKKKEQRRLGKDFGIAAKHRQSARGIRFDWILRALCCLIICILPRHSAVLFNENFRASDRSGRMRLRAAVFLPMKTKPFFQTVQRLFYY